MNSSRAKSMQQQQQQQQHDIPHRLSSDDSSSSIDSNLLEKEISSIRQREPFWRRNYRAFLVHLAILFIYLISVSLLVAENWRLQALVRPSLLESPANEAVHWEVQEWHAGDGLHEPYVGEPRPELEEAWKGLLGNMNVRLSLDDIKAFNREESAIALPDGSGYLGTLNVYHEIHCIRWLHKYLYQEHYFPGLDDNQRKKNKVHSEHCISTLRKFALCHGDVGLITYSWSPITPKPQANGTAHQCVNWERLHQWTRERSVDVFEKGLLVHPTLGPAYPDGEPQHGVGG